MPAARYIHSLLMPSQERMFIGTMFEVIPEERIKVAADVLAGEENNFAVLLECGKQFKQANLTPIYILNTKTADVYVTSMERMQKDFH